MILVMHMPHKCKPRPAISYTCRECGGEDRREQKYGYERQDHFFYHLASNVCNEKRAPTKTGARFEVQQSLVMVYLVAPALRQILFWLFIEGSLTARRTEVIGLAFIL